MANLCAQRVREEAPFEFFEPVAALPGFPRALARTLAELRLERVDASRLTAGDERSRDLGRILDRFERELEDGLCDRAALLDLASQAAPASRWAGRPLLLLDAWPDNRSEADLVGALARSASTVHATIPAGDATALDRLTACLGDSVVVVRSDGPGEHSLGLARRRLFAIEIEEEPRTRDDSLEFFSAPGEDRECVEIARRIHRLAGEGVAFDDVAILLRDVPGYLPLLEDALRRSGIGAYFSRGTARPDPAGRAFVALLACAAEGLSASRFAEFLSFGETVAPDQQGAPPSREVPWVEPSDGQLVFKSAEAVADPVETSVESALAGENLSVPAHWERLLVDAAVVGGLDRWQRRLDGLKRELELQIRDVGDADEVRQATLHRRLGRLHNLRSFALPVVEKLATLPELALWEEWLSELESLASLVLRSPTTVLGLLAELRPMAKVGPVSLEHVRGVLDQRLSFLQAEPTGRRYGRVFVGTFEEGLGRSFHTVFLPGLAEGIFPRKALEDPILLDEDRSPLSSDLAVQMTRFSAERSLLRWALGVADERLVASYPRLDAVQGRARVPSFYALDLLRAGEGVLPGMAELESGAGLAQLNWPAPEQREEAIDETEYDLAFLAPLLRPDAKDVAGRGRFLLLTNPRLARSLRARAYRWHPLWSHHDGLVVDRTRGSLDEASTERARQALADQLPSRRSYSPTALQSWAACPYRFVLQAVHRLRPREEIAPLEQMDPLTRGGLFHEAQYRFLSKARDAGLLPVHEDFRSRLLLQVDEALDEVACRWRDRLAPAILRVWESEIEGLRLDLRGWVDRMLGEAGDWVPVAFELSFGLPLGDGRDPASREAEAVVLEGVRLRGSIDLVERDWKRRRLRVTDHKTGKTVPADNLLVGAGEVLQPTLYALAAQSFFAREGEVVESGRLSFCTQRGGHSSIEVTNDARSRQAVDLVIQSIERSLIDGFLPAAPRDGACQWCDYRQVCGPYEEIRLRRKQRDALEPLSRVRELR